MGCITMAAVSRTLQTALTIAADLQYLSLARAVDGSRAFRWSACVVHLLSWSSSYMLSRPLANSCEQSLLVIGTALLLRSRHVSAMWAAALSVYLRPTSALYWAPLGLLLGYHGAIPRDSRLMLTVSASSQMTCCC